MAEKLGPFMWGVLCIMAIIVFHSLFFKLYKVEFDIKCYNVKELL